MEITFIIQLIKQPHPSILAAREGEGLLSIDVSALGHKLFTVPTSPKLLWDSVLRLKRAEQGGGAKIREGESNEQFINHKMPTNDSSQAKQGNYYASDH